MKPLIIGNWKMNGSLATNLSLLSALVEQCDTTVADWVICPPFPYLAQCQQLLDQSSIACGRKQSAHHQGRTLVKLVLLCCKVWCELCPSWSFRASARITRVMSRWPVSQQWAWQLACK